MISWDNFKKQSKMENNVDYAKTNITCPKCGRAIWKCVSVEFPSNPPKHQYRCFICGWTEVG